MGGDDHNMPQGLCEEVLLHADPKFESERWALGAQWTWKTQSIPVNIPL
jgi:hypothetical protein